MICFRSVQLQFLKVSEAMELFLRLLHGLGARALVLFIKYHPTAHVQN